MTSPFMSLYISINVSLVIEYVKQKTMYQAIKYINFFLILWLCSKKKGKDVWRKNHTSEILLNYKNENCLFN